MSKKIKYKTISSDSRGTMMNLFDHNVQNVTFLSSNAKSIRSNHYHINDWHYIYILKGKIDYFYGNIDCELDELKYMSLNEGECVFTPNNEFHTTFFPVDTEILVFNNQSRDQDTYENDLVRRDLVTQNNIHKLIEKFNV